MNKKKVILLIVIICLLTGCNVKETIIINKDLSVNEEVNMSGTKAFFDNRYKMLPKNVVKNILKSYDREKLLNNNNYLYEQSILGKYPSIIAKKEYSNIDIFTKTTIFKDQYFKTFNTFEEDNLITINAKDYVKYEQGDLERYPIANCEIDIKLPFQVVDSNADKYNARTNTYIWYINEKTNDKEINIKFNKNKIYVYNYSLYITIGILIIIIIIGIGFIIKIINKNKKINEI